MGWGRRYLKASDTQYEMKLVTPHFRAWRGTGSRSLFVLVDVSLQCFLKNLVETLLTIARFLLRTQTWSARP